MCALRRPRDSFCVCHGNTPRFNFEYLSLDPRAGKGGVCALRGPRDSFCGYLRSSSTMKLPGPPAFRLSSSLRGPGLRATGAYGSCHALTVRTGALCFMPCIDCENEGLGFMPCTDCNQSGALLPKYHSISNTAALKAIFIAFSTCTVCNHTALGSVGSARHRRRQP